MKHFYHDKNFVKKMYILQQSKTDERKYHSNKKLNEHNFKAIH